ncbi:Hsp20/alpha crystallin family protein [Luteimonas yindakuii]|uniref:Hsp20/alpha crystallin family protein n=1 Tax=Luteimonas yindakuii TaxID=2565782 RepID=UPI0010A2CFC7|nr:Hsp20/alpha crystallin family protein [Luteimonas yindakuii]QCO67792.1 Hsp20/alpha crystallin family protein [Luteimonas yindakuii]
MRHAIRHPLQGVAQSGLHDDLRQAFNQFFQGDEDRDGSSVVTSQWTPRVDIKEEADRFVILADLPGVDPEDVEVLMDKGILSIRGERQAASRDENTSFSRIERRYGSFHRRFALPDSADPEGVTASGHNGVLEISIPKRPETTPRRIQVGRTGHTLSAQ